MTCRVMIVEPDPLHMKMFDDLMRAEDLDTELFRNYNIAPDDIQKDDLALMLVSVDFPDETGLEFIKSIQIDCKIKRTVPVIAIFGHASSVEFERLCMTGCDDYIPKPISVSRLLLAVSKSLRR
jgi:two-component system, cell cycle response regulator DivK